MSTNFSKRQFLVFHLLVAHSPRKVVTHRIPLLLLLFLLLLLMVGWTVDQSITPHPDHISSSSSWRSSTTRRCLQGGKPNISSIWSIPTRTLSDGRTKMRVFSSPPQSTTYPPLWHQISALPISPSSAHPYITTIPQNPPTSYLTTTPQNPPKRFL